MNPLAGITVVALAQAVAAPFATRQLAGLGARLDRVIARADVVIRNLGPGAAAATLRGSRPDWSSSCGHRSLWRDANP